MLLFRQVSTGTRDRCKAGHCRSHADWGQEGLLLGLGGGGRDLGLAGMLTPGIFTEPGEFISESGPTATHIGASESQR